MATAKAIPVTVVSNYDIVPIDSFTSVKVNNFNLELVLRITLNLFSIGIVIASLSILWQIYFS